MLTHIREANRILMYRGFPRAFHLKRDGTFSYIVLQHVRRGYLVLDEQAPSASHHGEWQTMGLSTRLNDAADPTTTRRRYVESFFAIEGEDIANIVFDRYDVAFKFSVSDKELLDTMRRVLEELNASDNPAPAADSSAEHAESTQ